MTSQRRPHWDDQLVTAVIHEIGVLRPSPPPLANTAYAVIAAVEDWQIARMKGYLGQEPVGILTDLGNAEAAIQRVREVCDKPTMRTTDISGVTEWVRVHDIKTALDGDA